MIEFFLFQQEIRFTFSITEFRQRKELNYLLDFEMFVQWISFGRILVQWKNLKVFSVWWILTESIFSCLKTLIYYPFLALINHICRFLTGLSKRKPKYYVPPPSKDWTKFFYQCLTVKISDSSHKTCLTLKDFNRKSRKSNLKME